MFRAKPHLETTFTGIAINEHENFAFCIAWRRLGIDVEIGRGFMVTRTWVRTGKVTDYGLKGRKEWKPIVGGSAGRSVHMTFLPGTRTVCQRRLARCSIIFLSENQELNVSSSLLIFIHKRSQQWITPCVSYCCLRGPETTVEVPGVARKREFSCRLFPC